MNDKREWPADMPVYASDLDADDARPRPDADPAEEMTRLIAATGLAEHLDAALAGAAAPRVWLFMHEPGQTHLAALTALSFAQGLAGRDQSSLVLDGDDRTTTLGRWYGRETSEGWIDLVRYGASIMTAGTVLPFPGRTAYLLGVGSYAPTDATPEELGQLLGRLRRQADDVLVVVPVDAAGDWGEASQIRLLCLDRAQRDGAAVVDLVGELADAGAPPTGLVAWGSAATLVEEILREEPPPKPPKAPKAPKPDKAPVAAPAPATDDVAATPAVRQRGTSGIFWFAALAAVVVIAAVGTYYLRYVRTADDDAGAPAPVVARPEPAPVPVALDTALTARPDSAEIDAAAAAADTQQVAAATPPPVAEPEPAPEAVTPAKPEWPEFDPTSFQGEVGAAGWALHLYSFPDSSDAVQEMAELEDRGLEAAVRTVVVPDKGLYHRVFVGSFPDRAAARAAMPGLLEKLGVDWANPVRMPAPQE